MCLALKQSLKKGRETPDATRSKRDMAGKKSMSMRAKGQCRPDQRLKKGGKENCKGAIPSVRSIGDLSLREGKKAGKNRESEKAPRILATRN